MQKHFGMSENTESVFTPRAAGSEKKKKHPAKPSAFGTGVLIGFTHKCRKIKGFRRST